MHTPDDDDRKAAGSGARSVVVARFLSVAEAELAVSVLDGAGIDARLRDRHTIGLNWFYAPAMGGVALEVPAARRGEAMEILQSAEYVASRRRDHIVASYGRAYGDGSGLDEELSGWEDQGQWPAR